jgi:recombination protein RecA
MIFFTNQIRMKIGVMFGSPETTTGGNALKFYASMRLDVRRIGAIKETTAKEVTVVGNRTRVKVVKNKMAPPFREVEFDILYGKGISRSGEVVDMGVDAGLVQKSGAWYSAGGERIGQGRENARAFMDQNPKLMADIEKKVLIKHGIGQEEPTSASTTADSAGADASGAAGSAKGSAPQGKAGKANGAAKRGARPN